MARYTGPKNKLARRAGIDLGLKTDSAKVEKRLNIPPGQHGRKGRRKFSDYGRQLLEKQKLKWTYGVLEKQVKKYFQKATKTPKATGEVLLALLEKRLDNVVYRLKFAPTRASARQLISHGSVFVNDRKINIPSYNIANGDIIRLSRRAMEIPAIKKILAEKSPVVPKWIQRKGAVGKVLKEPKREEIDLDINVQLIVEYYSK